MLAAAVAGDGAGTRGTLSPPSTASLALVVPPTEADAITVKEAAALTVETRRLQELQDQAKTRRETARALAESDAKKAQRRALVADQKKRKLDAQEERWHERERKKLAREEREQNALARGRQKESNMQELAQIFPASHFRFQLQVDERKMTRLLQCLVRSAVLLGHVPDDDFGGAAMVFETELDGTEAEAMVRKAAREHEQEEERALVEREHVEKTALKERQRRLRQRRRERQRAHKAKFFDEQSSSSSEEYSSEDDDDGLVSDTASMVSMDVNGEDVGERAYQQHVRRQSLQQQSQKRRRAMEWQRRHAHEPFECTDLQLQLLEVAFKEARQFYSGWHFTLPDECKDTDNEHVKPDILEECVERLLHIDSDEMYGAGAVNIDDTADALAATPAPSMASIALSAQSVSKAGGKWKTAGQLSGAMAMARRRSSAAGVGLEQGPTSYETALKQANQRIVDVPDVAGESSSRSSSHAESTKQATQRTEHKIELRRASIDAGGFFVRESPYMSLAEKVPLLFRYGVAPEATEGSMRLLISMLRRKREQERAFGQRVLEHLQSTGGAEVRWKRRQRRQRKAQQLSSRLAACCIRSYEVLMLFTFTRKLLFLVFSLLVFIGIITGMIFVADRRSEEWAGTTGG
jgi:hypothetical protein